MSNSTSATTALELAFATKSLRQICESNITAKRKLGQSVAEKLKHRIADLYAAKAVNDLIAGDPRVVDGSNDQHYMVDLPEGYSIVFCSNHNSDKVRESGHTDWSKVSRIKILAIRNSHE